MHAYGLDCLGAEPIGGLSRPSPMSSVAVPVGAGIIAAALVRKHPVLAFLSGSVLAGNAQELARGSRTWKDAGKRVVKHAAAVAGALAVPSHPAPAYVLSAIVAEVALGSEDDGIVRNWARFVGVREPEVIEVKVEERQ